MAVGWGEGLEGTVATARDDEHVDEPDDAGRAKPVELGQNLAGERRLVEADHEDLDELISARPVLGARRTRPR